ncbi:MAG: DNA replication/repair protein RecF [Clostridia bacterium]|nr:DNA replication/repair protein RecF [Clostridia bacterium]
MYVQSVFVKNYRNLKEQKVALKNGLNVFCGLNAQGKTNFLECLVLSSLGKTPKSDKDKDIINWNEQSATIKTEVVTKNTKSQIEIKLSKGEKKRIATNGMPVAKIGELLGWLNVIYFSPAEIDVIREGPDERRRFMDIDLCQTDKNYFYTLARYNKILNQRNNLLKKENNNKNLAEMLSIWDRQLAKEGAKLFLKRLDFIQKISPVANEIHKHLTSGKESLDIVYQSEMQGTTRQEAEEFLVQKLSDTFEKQQKLGFTTSGVHRDDIKFAIDGIDIRKFGSQGQQRTAALSLKLAEVKLLHDTVGEYPVLLLDDVFSEIDETRRKQLLKYTKNIQTIIATPEFDQSLANGISYNLFNVKDGVISNNKN